MRACSWNAASGTIAWTAAKASGVVRVTRSVWPCAAIRPAMAATCAGRLALAEDDLRKPLARGPVMVDPGEPQVLERLGAQPGDQVGVDRFDRDLAPLQAPEQVVEFVRIHGRAPLVCQRDVRPL